MPGETRRTDVWAIGLGVGFIAAYTAAIMVLGSRLAAVPHLSDTGPAWYYWKLAQPTVWTRLSAWVPYALHQLFVFGTIAWAQKQGLKYVGGLHRVNVVSLVGNAGFALLHLVQTHITYDGLAQDVHVFSALGSVAILLIWVLLMENPRRGLFLGKKVSFPRQLIDWARKYHGYYFSWAIVYTFWYHPAENSPGHLVGFFYLLLILLQGSLFFTRAHVNRWWTLTQEVLVLPHGAMVAWLQGQGLWPMFAFGFAGMFVGTQMHGLGWPRWAKVLVTAAWLGGAAWIYAGQPLAKVTEPLRIPFIDYLGVFALAGLIWAGLKTASLLNRGAERAPAET